jgi:D-inositol-3-phosphate glycosyltransferase
MASKKKPVISIIEPVGGHGGMNYYDFGLARGVAAAGCDVALYTSDETGPPHDANFLFQTPFRKIYGGDSKILRALRFMRGLFCCLVDSKKRGASIVHVHLFHSTLLENVFVRLVKICGFKLVVTVHDVESFAAGSSPDGAKKVFSFADMLIAHNEVSFQELVQKLDVAPSAIRKIRHGNYLDFLQPISQEAARHRLNIPLGSSIVLFFGQIKSVKGLDLLIRAIAKIADRHPTLTLLIAGKVWKDDFSKYEKLIDELNLSDRVLLHIRYIPDELVADYYSAANVVALPYRKIYQSGVLLMAMSLKSIVVTSDLLGMTEIVKDGVNGYTFVSEDADDLATKIDRALSSGLQNEISNAGYELMVAEYSWSLIGRETARVYEEVLAR